MTDQPLNDAQNNPGGETQQQPADVNVAGNTDANTPAEQQPTGGETDSNANGVQQPADGTAEGEGQAPQKDGEGDKGGEPKPLNAPEKYELEMPEGAKMTPEAQIAFEAIARKLDLSNDAAQELVKFAPEISKMQTQQLIEIADTTATKWHEQTRLDKELGGGGDKAAYDATMVLVARTRDAFGSPELGNLLQRFDKDKNPNGTGLGNHPEIIRLFARIGKSISEDNKLVAGGAAPQTHSGAADKLYSSTPKK